MTEIPKDSITAKEYRELLRNGTLTTKGKRIVQQELSPEYKEILSQSNETPCNSFIIHQKLITLNEYINIERTNRYKAAKIKKQLTGKCSFYAKNLNINSTGLYDVEIEWTVPDNRIDSDNLFFATKFLFDGIVKAGKLKDDNRKHIRHISNKIFTVKGKTQTKVTLIKV